MIRQLTAAEKAALRSARREGVVLALTRLPLHWRKRRWVAVTNRFADDLRSGLAGSRDARFRRFLGEYIAASGPIHCVDAWSYLGRSIAAEIRGDDHASLHLAYYSELRATLALLAAEGVGIFIRRHYIVDSAGEAQAIRVPRGNRPLTTHEATWRVLEHWAGLQRSANLIRELLSAQSISADEWLRAVGAPTSLLPIANSWFRTWGVDLRVMSLDRDARNVVSYRPTTIRTRPSYTLRDTTSFISGLWQVFEPQEGAPFETLDRFLNRRLIQGAYFGGSPPTETRRSALRGVCQSAGESMGLLTPLAESFASFIARDIEADDPYVLTRAGIVEDPWLRNRGPICRAALLARLATGAWSSVLQQAGVNWAQLGFWWQDLGHQRGFWEAGGAPDSMSDLWADVAVALEELEAIGSGFGAGLEAWNAGRPLAPALSVLDGMERVSLWGLSA